MTSELTINWLKTTNQMISLLDCGSLLPLFPLVLFAEEFGGTAPVHEDKAQEVGLCSSARDLHITAPEKKGNVHKIDRQTGRQVGMIYRKLMIFDSGQ